MEDQDSHTAMVPRMFGQKHSNRDYSNKSTWGKNQFNSSFPASLVAYMSSRGIDPVYVCLDNKNNVIHSHISGKELFGEDPLSDSLHYGFESNFFPYNKYYTGKSERIDLVLSDVQSNEHLKGLEVKLTALPDNTTKDLSEDKYSCEIVSDLLRYASLFAVFAVNTIHPKEKIILDPCFPGYQT